MGKKSRKGQSRAGNKVHPKHGEGHVRHLHQEHVTAKLVATEEPTTTLDSTTKPEETDSPTTTTTSTSTTATTTKTTTTTNGSSEGNSHKEFTKSFQTASGATSQPESPNHDKQVASSTLSAKPTAATKEPAAVPASPDTGVTSVAAKAETLTTSPPLAATKTVRTARFAMLHDPSLPVETVTVPPKATSSSSNVSAAAQALGTNPCSATATVQERLAWEESFPLALWAASTTTTASATTTSATPKPSPAQSSNGTNAKAQTKKKSKSKAAQTASSNAVQETEPASSTSRSLSLPVEDDTSDMDPKPNKEPGLDWKPVAAAAVFALAVVAAMRWKR